MGVDEAGQDQAIRVVDQRDAGIPIDYLMIVTDFENNAAFAYDESPVRMERMLIFCRRAQDPSAEQADLSHLHTLSNVHDARV